MRQMRKDFGCSDIPLTDISLNAPLLFQFDGRSNAARPQRAGLYRRLSSHRQSDNNRRRGHCSRRGQCHPDLHISIMHEDGHEVSRVPVRMIEAAPAISPQHPKRKPVAMKNTQIEILLVEDKALTNWPCALFPPRRKRQMGPPGPSHGDSGLL
jgi:hypothetical protein